jgi:hypothetical protein
VTLLNCLHLCMLIFIERKCIVVAALYVVSRCILNGIQAYLWEHERNSMTRHARHRGPGEARFGLWVSTKQSSPRRAGPDHALDLWYGVTLHIFIHGPDPTRTTHAVTYRGLHRGPYHSHDVGRPIVIYVLCTMSSMLRYPMHRTITSSALNGRSGMSHDPTSRIQLPGPLIHHHSIES